MIRISVIDQVWTFRNESSYGSRRSPLQPVVISQGEQATAPIDVSEVQIINNLNEIQRVIVTLTLRSDRVQFDDFKFEIDGLAISGKSIRATTRRLWACWDVEVELIPKRRIFDPIDNIQRIFIRAYPIALAQRRWVAGECVDVSYVSSPPVRVSRHGWQSSGGLWRQESEPLDEGRAIASPRTAFVAAENIRVGDFVEVGEDGLLRRARSIPEEFSHLPRVEFIGIDPARAEPTQPQAPAICQNCRNYHGQSYGGNFVVCGIHPYGNGEDCSDAG